jgi:hypothetical protein
MKSTPPSTESMQRIRRRRKKRRSILRALRSCSASSTPTTTIRSPSCYRGSTGGWHLVHVISAMDPRGCECARLQGADAWCASTSSSPRRSGSCAMLARFKERHPNGTEPSSFQLSKQSTRSRASCSLRPVSSWYQWALCGSRSSPLTSSCRARRHKGGGALKFQPFTSTRKRED